MPTIAGTVAKAVGLGIIGASVTHTVLSVLPDVEAHTTAALRAVLFPFEDAWGTTPSSPSSSPSHRTATATTATTATTTAAAAALPSSSKQAQRSEDPADDDEDDEDDEDDDDDDDESRDEGDSTVAREPEAQETTTATIDEPLHVAAARAIAQTRTAGTASAAKAKTPTRPSFLPPHVSSLRTHESADGLSLTGGAAFWGPHTSDGDLATTASTATASTATAPDASAAAAAASRWAARPRSPVHTGASWTTSDGEYYYSSDSDNDDDGCAVGCAARRGRAGSSGGESSCSSFSSDSEAAPGAAAASPRSLARTASWRSDLRREFSPGCSGTAVQCYSVTEDQGSRLSWEDCNVVFEARCTTTTTTTTPTSSSSARGSGAGAGAGAGVSAGVGVGVGVGVGGPTPSCSSMVFGVFDGHGCDGHGSRASSFCAQRVRHKLRKWAQGGTALHGAALRECFQATDAEFACEVPGSAWKSGTTALVAVVDADTLRVANAGDCRAVLCSNGRAVTLTRDHKPSSPAERSRITRVGGLLSQCNEPGGPLRIVSPDGCAALAVSRALGDHKFKGTLRIPKRKPVPGTDSAAGAAAAVSDDHEDGAHIQAQPAMALVSCEPQVVERQLLPRVDEFLVLASDGLWDTVSSETAVAIVQASGRRRAAACLVEAARKAGSTDNISVMVVHLGVANAVAK